jgi:hypothetical protein
MGLRYAGSGAEIPMRSVAVPAPPFLFVACQVLFLLFRECGSWLASTGDFQQKSSLSSTDKVSPLQIVALRNKQPLYREK